MIGSVEAAMLVPEPPRSKVRSEGGVVEWWSGGVVRSLVEARSAEKKLA